ncbi:hypothetical protein BGZ83_006579 [Gryganskiella cystojenkinii]|nr:hypothetical protein BGZ83_006579 [Gryganskiella cystojenkinii]
MLCNSYTGSSSHYDTYYRPVDTRQGTTVGDLDTVPRAGTDAVVTEVDDYFVALFYQTMLISDDRETGTLGKLSANSDTHIAIEHYLQEARELEQSYRLAKSLSVCEAVPEDLLEEITEQDSLIRADRDLAERLARQEPEAETSIQAGTVRFETTLRFFNTTSECVSCNSMKRTYIAPCQHAYCEECAQSLYSHALTNKSFIPVRCCRQPFASDVTTACLTDTDDLNKYEDMRREIEHPCPPVAELDAAAAKVISESGWKLCYRCGAVVERTEGCVHMTCFCRAEFCYTCQKPWQTCKCELYPAAELNRILNERIGDQNPGRARNRLQNVLQNYYRHEHNWGRENADGRICNVCHWNMPVYAMYCNICMEARCQRCCYNN